MSNNNSTVRGASSNSVSVVEVYNQLLAAASDVLGDKLVDVTTHDRSTADAAVLELQGPTSILRPSMRTFDQDYSMLAVSIAARLDGTCSVIVRLGE